MKNLIARFVREDAGQDLIEYALIGGLVSVGLVIALGVLKDEIGAVFTKIGTDLPGTP